MSEFETKDSGKREEYESGMVRDTQEGKPRYDLLDRPFLLRWAELMGRGADKYGEDNWRNADSVEELKRFEGSAFRHFMQWLAGDTDEDHAAAVAFNLAAAEYVKQRLAESVAELTSDSGDYVWEPAPTGWVRVYGKGETIVGDIAERYR